MILAQVFDDKTKAVKFFKCNWIIYYLQVVNPIRHRWIQLDLVIVSVQPWLHLNFCFNILYVVCFIFSCNLYVFFLIIQKPIRFLLIRRFFSHNKKLNREKSFFFIKFFPFRLSSFFIQFRIYFILIPHINFIGIIFI